MIRKWKIINGRYKEFLGYLYYNTETEEFKVEMLDDYTGLHPDSFMYELGVVQGKKWIEGHLADSYIKARVIPPNRQALSQALKDMGLTKYSVIDMLDKTHGYCQMDYNYFEEITNK